MELIDRVRLKICGMTRKKDIDAAIELGVDAIGVILYEKSRRYVDLKQAKALLANIPAHITPVAVLVNPDKSLVDAVLNELPIHYLQFHGNERADFCERFNVPYIKAIAASTSQDIIEACQAFQSSSAILLDTPSQGVHGGSGQSFDWQIIPSERSKPIILAGGVNEQNVAQAIQETKPYAVDVCSGVEESAGIKDYDKMKRLITAVRDYNEQ